MTKSAFRFSRVMSSNGASRRRTVLKTVLLMKCILLLLTAFVVTARAEGVAQSVSLTGKNLTLRQVFQSIEKQTGYVATYNKELVNENEVLTLLVRDMLLRNALDLIARQRSLTYIIQDKTIFLSPAGKASPKREELAAGEAIIPPGDFNGRVVDSVGQPLAGASVLVKGSRTGAQTDAGGHFTLKDLDRNAVLVVSYTGYVTSEFVLTEQAAGFRGTMLLSLKNSDSRLDEVQVIAYGTTSKRLSTGNVATVKAEDIQKQPVSNPIMTIAGRVAGVQVTEGGGIAGSNFKIVIQGQNTISAGLLPLYIIDGVPFGGKPVEATAGASTSAPPIVGGLGLSPLNTLSPSDIESITILKDADATAIYGSRAANGVVLITTKKGKAGKTKLELDVYNGISRINRMLPMLNAAQYLDMRRQAFKNDNITPTTANAADLTSFNTGSDNDFQKLFFGKTGHFTNVAATLSGGNDLTQFLVNVNHRHEGTVLPGNSGDDRSEIRYNLQHQTADKKFHINSSVSYTRDDNNIAPLYINQIYALPANLPLYNTNGSLAWYTGYTNPQAALNNIYNTKTNNLLANASLSYNIIPGLSVKTDFGYNRIGVNAVTASLIAAQNPANAATATGQVTKINTTNELVVIEPQLNYAHNYGKLKLDALIGGTYQNTNYNQEFFLLGSFKNDALYNDLGSITPLISANGFIVNKYVSGFGRLNFNWAGKYILNGSYRRDGSSRFSPGNRFGNFGSIGAAWIFSEENFSKGHINWLSFGKLRASYGSIGNDQINDYGYTPVYQSGFTTYNGQTGLAPSGVKNNGNYSWEVTKKLNVSIDLGLLKDKITFTASYFRNRTSNLLVNNVPLASQAGFAGYVGNLPNTLVQNRGFEFELGTLNVQSKQFTWRTSANLTIARNKLLAYPALETASYSSGYFTQGYVVGQSLNLLSGYEYTGMKNGLPTVADLNGSGTITPGLVANNKGDFAVLGTKDPRFYGGLNNSLTYGRFQLDFLLQFVSQKGYNIYSYLNTIGFPAPGGNYNLPEDILHYNFTYSTLASSAASQAYNNYFKLSSATVSDASFVRLKNVSLAYKFPQGITGIGVKSLNLYFRGQNLFTVTKYIGFDPETQGSAIPPMKLYTLGLQASF